MNLVLVGLNHRTAPVKLREQFSLPVCSMRSTMTDLGSFSREYGDGSSKIVENIFLSTCNRLEIYAVSTGEVEDSWDLIVQYLSNLQGIAEDQLRQHLYFMEGQATVIQLMRVAAGLDSMVLGEPQILGQVSSAWSEAHAADSTGPILSHLFDAATHAGKRARTETEIGRHTTSVSHAAARLIQDKVDAIDQSYVAVVGAGEMALLAAQALQAMGTPRFSFLNRTYSRALEIASQFECEALNWYHLPGVLAEADVVITATGAPHVVIREADVRPVLADRNKNPLIIVDIAVPRDVEESIGDLPGVKRYDIDHLQSTVEANLAQRKAAIPDVEAIIDEEADRFDHWLQGRQVLPVLVELRQRAMQIADSELEHHRHYLDDLDPQKQEVVLRMVQRIINKVLHEPTIRLKASAAEGNGVAYAHAIRELFALESDPVEPNLLKQNKAKRANGKIRANTPS